MSDARAQDAALRARPDRVKLRHHVLKVIAGWQKAAKASKGAERAEAIRGEAEAWRLLARWSGRADDKARAEALLAAKVPATEKEANRTSKKVAEESKRDAGPTFLNGVTLDGARLVLKASGDFDAQVERIRLGGKERIYVALSPVVAAREVLGAVRLRMAAVSQARVLQFDPRTVRVVFDVTQGHELAVQVVGGAIELGTQKEVVAQAEEPKEVEPATKTEVDEADPRRVAAKLADALSQLEARQQERVEPRRTLLPQQPSMPWVRVRRVVVDAGHGGKDHGATGVNGVREKDVNLAIAKKLGAKLEKKLGVKVIYTRSSDRFVSLPGRAALANAAEADLFISVHSNASTHKRVHGIETYYLDVTSNRYADRLAQRENGLAVEGTDADPEEVAEEADAARALPPGSLGRDLKLILADLAMRSATAESRRLAGYVQRALISEARTEHKDVKDLGVKHALFYVLLGARMPSILVETGFVSHPTEGRRLASARYQDQVAEAIAAGVVRFVGERERVARRSEGGVGTLASRAAP